MPLKRSCKHCNSFWINHAIPAIIAIGFTVLLPSCVSFDSLTEVTEDSFPQASQCGKCHVDIYHEWAHSDHATAYTNPHFQKATNDYQFEDCLSCHAPQPTRIDKPVTRTIHRDEGVTCVCCHLEEGKLSGPLDPTGKIAPHPVGVDPEFYKNSLLCGTCHQGEYAEWENAVARDKQTCQDCHMPEVLRKVTQATGGMSNLIVAFEDEVRLKKHDFTILSKKTSLDFISIEQCETRTDGTVFRIKNNLPHSLPAGDYGFRVLVLEAFAVSPDGNQTLLDRRELIKEVKSEIPPLGTIDWQLEIPPDTAFVQFEVSRLSYHDEIVCLTQKRLTLR